MKHLVLARFFSALLLTIIFCGLILIALAFVDFFSSTSFVREITEILFSTNKILGTLVFFINLWLLIWGFLKFADMELGNRY